MIAAWAVGFVSIFLLAGVETAALHNPTEPTGEYTVPMTPKSLVHYVTPDQAFYDRLAFCGFIGGILAFVLFMMVSDWLQARQKRHDRGEASN